MKEGRKPEVLGQIEGRKGTNEAAMWLMLCNEVCLVFGEILAKKNDMHRRRYNKELGDQAGPTIT